MPQSHIRIARTPEVDKVLSYLRNKFNLLSEAEIIKLALSEKYQKEMYENMEEKKQLRDAFYHAMDEGKKIGVKLMKEKGLDPEKVTEQEFYDRILAPRKDHD